MGFALLHWLLVSLLSISLVGNHPLWALGFGAFGGTGIGIWLWLESIRRMDSTASAEVPGILVYAILIGLPLVFILLFSRHFPTSISILACIILFALWIFYRIASQEVAMPLDLSVFLLLLLPATLGLLVSPNLQFAKVDVFGLFAGISLFYFIIRFMKIILYFYKYRDEMACFLMCVIGFVLMGAMCAIGALFVMIEPPVKLPILGSLFAYLPDLFLRSVNPNYVGGILVVFFSLSIWGLSLFKNRNRWVILVLFGVITGGLLLTQSRGALLGAGGALGVTLAYQYRWVRWVVLLGILGGGLLLIESGMGIMDQIGTVGSLTTYEQRLKLWQRGIYIVQDFSFSGIGLRGFPVVIDQLYPLFLFGPDARVPHSHNIFLQVAVDMGIPGFVAFWMLLGVWAGMVWESLRMTSAGSDMEMFRPLVLGLSGGMVAHLIYGMMDAITLGEKAGVVFWILLGLTVAVWQQVRCGDGHGHREQAQKGSSIKVLK